MSAAEDPRMSLIDLAKRSAVIAGVVAVVAGAALFVWTVSEALLVLFAAILFAVMLDGLTRLLMRGTRLPRPIALLLVVVFVFACVAGIFVGGSARVASKAPQLRQNMEQSIQRIEDKLHDVKRSAKKLDLGSASGKNSATVATIAGRVKGYLSTSIAMVADLLIILVAGIYFAASPRFYIDTPVKLVPRERRPRLREVAREVGHALRRWLVGRFASMLAVGLITGIGLSLLGVPLAILLAAIACLLTFIPYLGTIISLIPAILVALSVGPFTALYVVLLFLGAHALEGYVLSPLIQSRTVHLAPGWLILSQLVGGLAAGVFGILIAAPLLVTLAVLVQLLYVKDVLGDDVHVLGQ